MPPVLTQKFEYEVSHEPTVAELQSLIGNTEKKCVLQLLVAPGEI